MTTRFARKLYDWWLRQRVEANVITHPNYENFNNAFEGLRTVVRQRDTMLKVCIELLEDERGAAETGLHSLSREHRIRLLNEAIEAK